jgi:hypothetical protein
MKPYPTKEDIANKSVNSKAGRTGGKIQGKVQKTVEVTDDNGVKSTVQKDTSLKTGDLQYVIKWPDNSVTNESFKDLELV